MKSIYFYSIAIRKTWQVFWRPYKGSTQLNTKSYCILPHINIIWGIWLYYIDHIMISLYHLVYITYKSIKSEGIIRSAHMYECTIIVPYMSYRTVLIYRAWISLLTLNKNNRRRRIVSLERTETLYRIRYRHNWTRRKHSWKYILTFSRLIPNWRKIWPELLYAKIEIYLIRNDIKNSRINSR